MATGNFRSVHSPCYAGGVKLHTAFQHQLLCTVMSQSDVPCGHQQTVPGPQSGGEQVAGHSSAGDSRRAQSSDDFGNADSDPGQATPRTSQPSQTFGPGQAPLQVLTPTMPGAQQGVVPTAQRPIPFDLQAAAAAAPEAATLAATDSSVATRPLCGFGSQLTAAPPSAAPTAAQPPGRRTQSVAFAGSAPTTQPTSAASLPAASGDTEAGGIADTQPNMPIEPTQVFNVHGTTGTPASGTPRGCIEPTQVFEPGAGLRTDSTAENAAPSSGGLTPTHGGSAAIGRTQPWDRSMSRPLSGMSVPSTEPPLDPTAREHAGDAPSSVPRSQQHASQQQAGGTDALATPPSLPGSPPQQQVAPRSHGAGGAQVTHASVPETSSPEAPPHGISDRPIRDGPHDGTPEPVPASSRAQIARAEVAMVPIVPDLGDRWGGSQPRTLSGYVTGNGTQSNGSPSQAVGTLDAPAADIADSAAAAARHQTPEIASASVPATSAWLMSLRLLFPLPPGPEQLPTQRRSSWTSTK
jgi:hypothetical protein